MKLLLLLFTLVSIAGFAQRPDFGIYGYAAMEGTGKYFQAGGTTGGEGGPIVIPTTVDELRTYAESDDPYIIMITKEFKGPGVIAVGSNTTLLGVGTDGFIWQLCLQIQCKHNIIIRNIRMTMTGVALDNNGENKIIGTRTDPDCIAMQADNDNLPEADRITHHIWIDHCEFYNEDPAVMTEKDRYDGLCDMKNDCQNITISWNYFHDHHKTCLIGKGNSDNYDRTVTYHHNRFVNILSRIPLVRYSYIHFYNNFVDRCENGMNVRINSKNYVDYNYYKDTKKPIFGKPTEFGAAHLESNTFDNCDVEPSGLKDDEKFFDTDYVPPYLSSITRDATADIPTIVTQWSGIGKLAETPIETFTLTVTSPANGTIAPATSEILKNTNVTITATPQNGYQFVNWTGDASGTTNPFTIKMNADKSVGTVFEAIVVEEADVVFALGGTGHGVIDISVDVPYFTGDEVTAIAHHYIGSKFTGWSGSSNSTYTNLDITVLNDATYTANFESITGATIYEFENGHFESAYAVFEDTHAGYTGIGYVNTVNGTGNWTEVTVYAPEAGEYSCSVNHAAVTDRSVAITVNGTNGTSVTFPSSTSWDIWVMTDFVLNLVEGENVIRFTAEMGDGCPNLDRIEIEAPIVEPTVQIMEMQKGWNLVSVFVEADDMSIPSVFPHAMVVKTASAFWSASQPEYLNGLATLKAGDGYLVLYEQSESVEVSGFPMLPGAIVADGTWKLIGSPYSVTKTLEDAFGTEIQNIEVIKDFDEYWLPDGSGTMTEMKAGKAYFVR